MKKFLCLISIFTLIRGFSQQIPTLNLSNQNVYLINPGAVGAFDNNISFHVKRWWSGFDGAPTMQSLVSNVKVNESIGIGGKIFNYATGPLSKMGVEGTYAYHLKLGDNGNKLSLALSAQLYQFYLNKSLLKLEESDDQAILSSSEKLIVPDAGFGVFFYNSNYFAGVSVYQLFNRKVNMLSDNIFENRQVRHYFLTAGYHYDFNEIIAIEPFVLAKYIEANVLQADVILKGIYKKIAWLGLGYRTSDAIFVNIGADFDKITVGYSYDYTTSKLNKYSVGSHELMLAYRFGSTSRKKLD